MWNSDACSVDRPRNKMDCCASIKNVFYSYASIRNVMHSYVSIRNVMYFLCIDQKRHAFLCIYQKRRAFLCIDQKCHTFLCIDRKRHAFLCIDQKCHAFLCIDQKRHAFLYIDQKCHAFLCRPIDQKRHALLQLDVRRQAPRVAHRFEPVLGLGLGAGGTMPLLRCLRLFLVVPFFGSFLVHATAFDRKRPLSRFILYSSHPVRWTHYHRRPSMYYGEEILRFK